MNISFAKKPLNEVAQTQASEVVDPYNKAFESVLNGFQGKPVDQIKLAIKTIFEAHGGSIDDADLESYSALISEGKRVCLTS